MANIEIAGAPEEHLATLLAIGLFDQVEVSWSPESFEPTGEQRGQVEGRWAPKAAKGYFPGPVARMTDFEIEEGKLRLLMQPTTFKQYVGLQTNDDALKFGITNLANPLSVSMAVHTADNKWLLTKKMQGDRIGSIDAVGGYMNPERDDNDVRKTALREYCEETGSSADSVSGLFFLALEYEFKDLCHPVLAILIESSLASQAVLKLAPKKSDGEVDLIAVENPCQTIREMSERGVDIEPDGQLTFALAQTSYLNFLNLEYAHLNDSSLKLNLMIDDVKSRISDERVKFGKK